MKHGDKTRAAAVVADPRGVDAAAISAYLTRSGLGDADWYLPRDVDELDAAVQAGVVRTVVFPSIAEALQHGWDETAALATWPERGGVVRFAEEPADGGAWLAAVWASWQAWRVRRRRRQAVAGAVLGTIALAAACVLMLLR